MAPNLIPYGRPPPVSSRALVLYQGAHGAGLSIAGRARYGPITLVGFVRAHDGRLELLIAEGEAIPGDTLELGIERTRLRFVLAATELHARWSAAGPTFHVALARGHVIGDVRAFAHLIDVRSITIADTADEHGDPPHRLTPPTTTTLPARRTPAHAPSRPVLAPTRATSPRPGAPSGPNGGGPSAGARNVPCVPSRWDHETPSGLRDQLAHRGWLLTEDPAVMQQRCGSLSAQTTTSGRELLWADRSEALLHAQMDAAHVDHTHPDAIAMLCCAANGEQLARACFGDELAWVDHAPTPAVRAEAIGRAAQEPAVRFVLLAHDGLVSWGETSADCYAATIATTNRAAAFVSAQAHGPRFGGPALSSVSEARRILLIDELLPVLYGAIAGERVPALQVDTSPRVRELVCSRDGAVLTQAGAACAAHVAHTGHVPLWLDVDPWLDGPEELVVRLGRGATRHRAAVGAYADELCPRVVLIAGVGMVTAGPTPAEAELTRDVFLRAIEAMAGAASIDCFAPLPHDGLLGWTSPPGRVVQLRDGAPRRHGPRG